MPRDQIEEQQLLESLSVHPIKGFAPRTPTKRLYTLCVGDYAPDIVSVSLPLLRRYAAKIGAEFTVISERWWPDLPPVLEKFQIWFRAQQPEFAADWHLFFDADTLIHPDMWDITSIISKDTTISGMSSDFTPIRFKPDSYFLRDGRMIGKGNWFAVFSDWCLDYYHPPYPFTPQTIEELSSNITLTAAESASGLMRPSHLIDDYIVSRNIARFGLKHVLVKDLAQSRGVVVEPFFWHQYLHDVDKKAVIMRQVLTDWGLDVGKLESSGEVSMLRACVPVQAGPQSTPPLCPGPGTPIPPTPGSLPSTGGTQ